MSYCLYILHAVSYDRYYIGSSQNPEIRLTYHNLIERGFTSQYRPWKLIYVKEFPDKKTALQVERKIKSWKSKKMIEKLLRGEVSL